MAFNLYDVNFNTERENIWMLVLAASRQDAIKITRSKLQRDFIRALVRTRILIFTTSGGPAIYHLGDSLSENTTYADDETEYTISNQLWLEPVPNYTNPTVSASMWFGSILKTQPHVQRSSLKSTNYFVSAPQALFGMNEKEAMIKVYEHDAQLRPSDDNNIDACPQLETHVVLLRIKLTNVKGENVHMIQQETT